MLFNSLRSKLTFATSMTTAIIFGVVVAYSVITGRDKAINAAKVEFHEKAKRVSLLLKGTIDNSFSILQTQNIILKTLDNNGTLDKSTALDIIKSNLLVNGDFVGMCVMFEPNSLCVNDTSLSNFMEKGIFIPYLYYNTQGSIALEPLMDYDVEGIGDYYLIPKQTHRPLLTEPFFYPINGKDVFMVTLSEPIIQNNVFLGITTIDYDINFIQHLCQDLAQEVNYGNSNVAVISNQGIIVANSADSLLIGKNIHEIYSHEVKKQFEGIKEGKEEILFQNGYLILDIPVVFSETATPWRIHVAVPRTDIFAEARQQTWILIVIGAVLIFLAVTMIYILTGKLTQPLFKLVENTKKIAAGDLAVEIKAKQNDEVGTLAGSFNTMAIHLREMIDALQSSIKQVEKKNIELEMHRNNLENLVAEKTQDLKTAYDELQANNDELYIKNNIIHDQNLELKSTLQDLKETQAQLLHSEKMASLGILTAGVAHEINNPLNYIMGAYEGLLRHFENNSFNENYEELGILINALKKGVDRSAAIVQGLNQFSRKSDSYDEDCDLHAIIDNSLTMLKNIIKHYITINKEFYPFDIIIKGNVSNLHQVFINILNNAIQAIDAKGEITIKTEYKKPKVIIEISDTGKGIPPENITKVTDPFFTTKEPGKGTGLGLSITYNIIKEHKGKLEFKSELGKGTTVKIVLPNPDQPKPNRTIT